MKCGSGIVRDSAQVWIFQPPMNADIGWFQAAFLSWDWAGTEFLKKIGSKAPGSYSLSGVSESWIGFFAGIRPDHSMFNGRT